MEKSRKKATENLIKSERGKIHPNNWKILNRNGFKSPPCPLVEGNIGAQFENDSGAWIVKKVSKVYVVNDNHDLEKNQPHFAMVLTNKCQKSDHNLQKAEKPEIKQNKNTDCLIDPENKRERIQKGLGT